MLLVLLEPVNRADSKYVCIVWIGNLILREIFTADSRCRIKCRPRPQHITCNMMFAEKLRFVIK